MSDGKSYYDVGLSVAPVVHNESDEESDEDAERRQLDLQRKMQEFEDTNNTSTFSDYSESQFSNIKSTSDHQNFSHQDFDSVKQIYNENVLRQNQQYFEPSPRFPINLESEPNTLSENKYIEQNVWGEPTRRSSLTSQESPSPENIYLHNSNENFYTLNDKNNHYDIHLSEDTAYDRVANVQSNEECHDNFKIHEPMQPVVTNAEFLATDDEFQRLNTLYELRGREIDKLTTELEQVKSKNIILTREHATKLEIMRTENETTKAMANQTKILLEESNEKCANFLEKLEVYKNTINENEGEIKKLSLKLETSYSEIQSLQTQVKDLQISDGLAKSRQLHEDFLRKCKTDHKTEVAKLENQLESYKTSSDIFKQKVEELNNQINTMNDHYRNIIASKDSVIYQLNQSKEAADEQCMNLIQSHSDRTKTLLRVKELEEINAQNKQEMNSLKKELKEMKNSVKNYEFALKIRKYADTHPLENSANELGLNKVVIFDESLDSGRGNKKSPGLDYSITNNEIQSMISISEQRRDTIKELEESLGKKQKEILTLKSDIKSLNVEVTSLNHKLKEMTDKNNVKEINYISPCEDLIKVKLIEENTSMKEELTVWYKKLSDIECDCSSLKDTLDKFERYFLSSFKNEYPNDIDLLVKTIEKYKDSLETIKFIKNEIITNLRNEITLIKVDSRENLNLILRNLKHIANYVNENKHKKHIIENKVFDLFNETCKSFSNEALAIRHYLDSVSEESYKQKNENYEKEVIIYKLQGELSQMKSIKDDIEKKINFNDNNFKETFMTFHEDSIQKLKAEYKDTYSKIICNKSNEIRTLQEKLNEAQQLYIQVCKENELKEETLQNDLNSDKNNISEASLVEIDKLKQDNLQALNTIHQLNKDIEELRGKEKSHLDTIDKLSEDIIQYKTKFEDEIKTNEKAILTSKGIQTIPKDKDNSSLNQENMLELKLQNEKLEFKVKQYENSIDMHSKHNQELSENMALLNARNKEENELLQQQIVKLRSTIESLLKERDTIDKVYEENILKVSEELENKNIELLDQNKSEREIMTKCLNKLKEDLCKQESLSISFEKEVGRLKTKIDKRTKYLVEQYNNLKNQFEKYKEKSKKKIEIYVKEAERIWEDTDQKRREILINFEKWVKSGMENFSSAIDEVINELRIDQGVKTKSIYINSLQHLQKSIKGFRVEPY